MRNILALALLAAAGALIGLTEATDVKQAHAETATESPCAAQFWPAYSRDCIMTVDGDPLQRGFRVVAAY